MADPYQEPIEDDINLREKFIGGGHVRAEHPKEAGHRAQERINTEKSSTYNKLLTRVQQKSSDDDNGDDTHTHTIVADARSGIAQPDVESQVTHLMDLAIQKGPLHAVKVAQHMSNYYVLDAMHDRMLAEEFHNALEEKDLI